MVDAGGRPGTWQRRRIEEGGSGVGLALASASSIAVMGESDGDRSMMNDATMSATEVREVNPMVAGMVEILLVEDNPDDVELALYALKKRKVSNPIRVARDGAEALAAVFGVNPATHPPPRRPNVVLLDLKLPKVDGLDVLRQLRADPRTRTLPVVVMTTCDEDRDRIESYKLGVTSYIDKPIDFAQFVEVAETLGLYWAVVSQSPPLATGEDTA
jgi:two-component system response regulator